MKQYQSWGRYPRLNHAEIQTLYWTTDTPDFAALQQPMLPYGNGRSYGDSCLNGGGALVDVRALNRFIGFDEKSGLLRVEAGVLLSEVLKIFQPRGWFLPVTPGTKYVTVGGAIANDVHGKNHHKGGTFGCHVTQFELLRSDGQRFLCSPTQNTELFRATIGGLGLTGLITWAEFRLKPVSGPYIQSDNIKFANLKEFVQITNEIDDRYEYTVAWVDVMATGKQLGRGHYTLGNHYDWKAVGKENVTPGEKIKFPLEAPNFAVNTLSVKAFNALYFHRQIPKRKHAIKHYDPFFYPLDAISDWNKAYGSRGFYQYQCVIPIEAGYEPMEEILERIAFSGEGTPLIVLKMFGDVKSPGMMSFPQAGLTLALDFANNGRKSLLLMEDLDRVTRESGGRVYPAKDARMSALSFQTYFPQWRDFARYIDPKFSSSFWQRVTAGAALDIPMVSKNGNYAVANY
jgi:FAD/FMN-containing dehydrogenase